MFSVAGGDNEIMKIEVKMGKEKETKEILKVQEEEESGDNEKFGSKSKLFFFQWRSNVGNRKKPPKQLMD